MLTECMTDGIQYEDNLQSTRIAQCILPFRHDGVTYNGCTSLGQSKPWCATKVNASGNLMVGNYGFCKMRTQGGFCPVDKHVDGEAEETKKGEKCVYESSLVS